MRHPASVLRLLCTILLILLSSLGCASRIGWSVPPRGVMSHPELDESSGVVVSRQFPNVLWTHNDDGSPELFAVEENGTLLRRYVLPGTDNVDWEDISLDDQGYLYIYDNTSRMNEDHRSYLYVLREPNPRREQSVGEVRRVSLVFPDAGFDTEAMFVWNGSAYFVTKPWDGREPRVYRLRDLRRGGTAEFQGKVPVRAMITGADISREGTKIALSSYRALFIFEGLPPPAPWYERAPLVCPLNAGQVEGVAWQGQTLVLTNEERETFQVPASRWSRNRAPFLKSRRATVPFVASKPHQGNLLDQWSSGKWLFSSPARGVVRIGRLAWSPTGLHVGIDLPGSLELGHLEPEEGSDEGLVTWFEPGRVYLLVNPAGDRPLAFGTKDRCLVIGRDSGGNVVLQARWLSPATVVESMETQPAWVDVSDNGQRLLITIRSEFLGPGELRRGRRIGFNLLVVGNNRELLSWTPLTLRFSFDSPSVWGLLELGP